MTAFDTAWGLLKMPTFTAYHGGGKLDGETRHPMFFTTDQRGADWYADERGNWMNTVDLTIDKPANLNIVEQIAHELNRPDDLVREQDNPFDWLYDEVIRNRLKEMGYDGVSDMDVLTNFSIPTHVPLNESQYRIKDQRKVYGE